MSTSIIKQSLKTSLVNYLGVILGAFFTVYLAPRYLTVEYNGLYRLLLEYAAIMAVYFNLGIPTVINKYYFQFFKEGAINRGFDFFVFIVPLILMGFGAVLFIFYRSEVVKLISSKEDYNFVYQYVLFLIPLIFSYAYFLILETYSAILGNIFVINFLKNIVVKLFNICSVICFIFTNDFFLSLYIVSFGTLLCILISFIYVLWLKKFKVNLLPSIAFLTGNKLLADFIKFTLFLAVSNLTYFLISKIDIYFVGRYTDLSNLAYYTTATFFVTIILVPYSAILNISFPKIAKVYFQQGIGEELKQMVKSNANFALAMATYIFLLVWIKYRYNL
ncbi:oligosaccharide flippase family protein [Sphingobacterium sp. MYb382]|uniref:oligosaccharide flippase family protein n=1 Tax=Sphingobacterium sp. MYb382 TaxID=2745278 RepID=UPI003097B68F